MYSTCGNERIPVQIEENLRDDDGNPTFGLFRPGFGISIDQSTPASERIDVWVHELSHAFEHRFGRVDPVDNEGRQNRAATIYRQFSRDLEAQGGEGALHALFGDEGDQVGDSSQYGANDDEADWPTSVCCPHCNTPYPSHVVRNGKPTFNPRLNGFMLKRVLICAKCDRETTWRQRCTLEGMPVPVVVVAPTSRTLPIT